MKHSKTAAFMMKYLDIILLLWILQQVIIYLNILLLITCIQPQSQ